MGDCVEVLQYLLCSSVRVDLIYLDPPFNSNIVYHVPLEEGRKRIRRRAFSDTWRLSTETQVVFEERLKPLLLEAKLPSDRSSFLSQFLEILSHDAQHQSMFAYLVYMTERLLLMKKLLKDTGSVYLHCDPKASHYLKVVMDAIFGTTQLHNEIIWYYNSGARSKHFGKRHDTIFWYTKSNTFTFNKDLVRVPYSPRINIPSSKTHYYHPNGKVCDDVWQIPILAQNDRRERSSYPTQKPLTLLNRIIQASSNPNDLILDPFCGSGTTLIAALQSQRHWIGIDQSADALRITKQRIASHTKDVPSPYTSYQLSVFKSTTPSYAKR